MTDKDTDSSSVPSFICTTPDFFHKVEESLGLLASNNSSIRGKP